MLRKVSHNPTGSHFIYLPSEWYNTQRANGWDGEVVTINPTPIIQVYPYPSPPSECFISVTPYRIPLAGGGTDLPEFYLKHNKSIWVSATINKYIRIILKRRFEPEIRLAYKTYQIATHSESIRHPVIRTIFNRYGLNRHIELISIGDLPSRLGLGSSSAFTVGLLNIVHRYLNMDTTPVLLAEEAFEIERNILRERVGKQDQYAVAIGGVNIYTADQIGEVKHCPIHPLTQQKLEKWLMLFYVKPRSMVAHEVLSNTNLDYLEQIHQIAIESVSALKSADIEKYAKLVDEHWKAKSLHQPEFYKTLIEKAKEAGAISGKLVGAGQDGCVLLLVPPENQTNVSYFMQSQNCRLIRFQFEPYGSMVMIC